THDPLPVAPAVAPVATLAAAAAHPAVVDTNTIHMELKPAETTPAATQTASDSPSLARSAILIWLVGLTTLLLRQLWQTLAMRRMFRQARNLEGAGWKEERDVVAQQLGL